MGGELVWRGLRWVDGDLMQGMVKWFYVTVAGHEDGEEGQDPCHRSGRLMS